LSNNHLLEDRFRQVGLLTWRLLSDAWGRTSPTFTIGNSFIYLKEGVDCSQNGWT
jgi:hypothetical protein